MWGPLLWAEISDYRGGKSQSWLFWGLSGCWRAPFLCIVDPWGRRGLGSKPPPPSAQRKMTDFLQRHVKTFSSKPTFPHARWTLFRLAQTSEIPPHMVVKAVPWSRVLHTVHSCLKSSSHGLIWFIRPSSLTSYYLFSVFFFLIMYKTRLKVGRLQVFQSYCFRFVCSTKTGWQRLSEVFQRRASGCVAKWTVCVFLPDARIRDTESHRHRAVRSLGARCHLEATAALCLYANETSLTGFPREIL